MFVVGARPFWSPIKYPPKMEVNAKIWDQNLILNSKLPTSLFRQNEPATWKWGPRKLKGSRATRGSGIEAYR